MLFKCIGGGLLLVSALVDCCGFERSTAHTKRIIQAWIALLTYIRTHIACFGTPLSDILLHADATVVACLTTGEEPLTAATLPACCRAHAAALPKECGELLFHLSEELGTVWRQEQIERLDYYIAALSEAGEAFFLSAGGAVRMRRTLTLCGAMGAILLVW